MGERLLFSSHLETVTCWAREGCGIAFAVPSTFLASLRAHDGELFCPRGHSLGFGKSDAEKLRAELEDEKRRTERQRKEKEWAQQATRKAERSRDSYKGKLGAAKKRHAAGVCPCCKRTFQQLVRHMASKHPGYQPEKDET